MSQRRHIVHIVYRFATGGLENGIVNLINHLPDQEFRHSIISLTGHDPEFAARLQYSVDFYDLKKAPGPDWKYYGRMWSLLRRLNPNVVHTRNLATLEYQIPAFLCRAPLRIHGEHGWDMADLSGKNRAYVRIKKALRPLVHQFIALSGQSHDYLVQRIKVPPVRCHQIINGVDTDRFTPSGPSITVPWPAPENDRHITFGCVGRLATVKNHRLLVEAFITLHQNHESASNSRLLIIGDGEHLPALQSRIDDAGLSNHVWFAGNQHNIPEFMRSFDVFVLPSLAEGISNTILEALASGLPVIATDVGGNAELVDPDQTGTLVPSDDIDAMANAMLNYIHRPELIATQGSAARSVAQQRFSLETMVSRYMALYRGPLQERR